MWRLSILLFISVDPPAIVALEGKWGPLILDFEWKRQNCGWVVEIDWHKTVNLVQISTSMALFA